MNGLAARAHSFTLPLLINIVHTFNTKFHKEIAETRLNTKKAC